ncbi:MAG: hypothetical protein ACLQVK_12345, partial [Acidimicrobiales bacterium]
APRARSPVYQPRLMDEEHLEMARHHAYGSLGLGPDPELAFVGAPATRGWAQLGAGRRLGWR